MSKRLFYTKLVLMIAVVVSAFVVVYVNLTYGQTVIHSDSAIAYRYFKSVEKTHELYPSTWNTGNGEVYTFSVLPFVIICNFLIGKASVACSVAYTTVYLILCVGFFWLFKKFFKNDAWLIAIPLYSAFLCSGMARFLLLIQGGYDGPVIAVTICAGLFFYVINSKEIPKRVLVIHSILVFMMLTCGVRYIAEYILPLLLALAIFVFLKKRKDYVEIVKRTSTTLLAPALLGHIVYKIICSHHNMNFGDNSSLQLDFSVARIIESIKNTIVNACIIFGYTENGSRLTNWISILITLLICVVFPVLQLVRIKNLSDNEQGYLSFGAIHNMALIGVIVLSHKTEERYLYGTVVVFLIISANYIYHVIANDREILRYLIVFLFVLATLRLSYGYSKMTIGWRERLATREHFVEELSAHGITKVYGTYWVGYPNEVYSNGQIRSGAYKVFGASLGEIVAQVDSDAFEPTEGRCGLIFTENEYNEQMRVYGSDPATRLVGEPAEVYVIDGLELGDLYDGSVRVFVYVYKNDIADRFTNGLDDGILNPRELDFNYGGVWEEDVIYITQGGIVHGPYLNISPGHYIVTVNGKNLNICEFDIYSQQQNEDIEYTLLSVSDEQAVMDLTIKKYINDIQFYVMNNMDGKAEFYNITIVQ
ncbi:hypothetical protein [Pseudobutyrivibrio xylanivorans]|uniref:Glycosyltransferase RgtA/B/C/D-like domain-containing protein n=1 Tax=Pseudobutyrivibrio xylanivorans TaxID=185007 RepID=A0A5P6VQI1_PSEXY|nr:hypothetical protein [Pseudobutyrivibrio xylanivorans]QFJ53949.1 hypothetical protein FXF36_03230 [Pseudobutyrivibrio xylanivorans]